MLNYLMHERAHRREYDMATPQSINISVEELLDAIKREYSNVAIHPEKEYHFHTGRAALDRIGYDQVLYAFVPEENITSFAGTGNPFSLGPINDGDVVVDVGSGSGFDALIASQMVGPEGRVVGIDMTHEMLSKARSGAKNMGANNIEFREGYADQLPLPANFADVLISNGVLNLIKRKPSEIGQGCLSLVGVSISATFWYRKGYRRKHWMIFHCGPVELPVVCRR
jgi:SAM-dependent methyltransferase